MTEPDSDLAALTGAGGPFELETRVVRGVPCRVFANGFDSLVAVWEAARAFAERDYLVYEGERWTYAAAFDAVARLAHHLQDAYGVGKGDRVAIATRNYPEWVISFWATQLAGAVAVPLNAWWTGPELRYALEDSSAVVLVADEERLERLEREPPPRELRGTVAVRTHRTGAEPLDDILAGSDPRPPAPPSVGPDDISTIIYTSGVTRRPKGVVLTHRNHVTNLHNMELQAALLAARAGSTAPRRGEGPQRSVMVVSPLFHIAGLAPIYTNTAVGARITLLRKWDTERVLEVIEREPVNAVGMMPTMLSRLLESERVHHADLSSVQAVNVGGSPVHPDLVAAARRRLPGARLQNAYGLTETTAAVVLNTGEDYLERPDSVGRVIPTVDLRVADPSTGDALPPGEVGELWFRGANVMLGYWQDAEATGAALADGWFRTGDLGRSDDEGFVYVVDRIKDVVIRGGENVYCGEVEATLLEHPSVAEAAAFGRPHPDLGEELVAVVVVLRGAEATEEELRAHVAARLAHYKVPAELYLSDRELPTTASGKILKSEIPRWLEAHKLS